jgi:hypothetical protein
VEHIGVPSGTRDARALELTHRRAIDGLGGRGSSGQRRQNLAWSGVLADVVDADRGESVGGTLHPRPAVATR